jgi:hypothetical protein
MLPSNTVLPILATTPPMIDSSTRVVTLTSFPVISQAAGNRRDPVSAIATAW